VAAARDEADLPLEALVARRQHLGREVDRAVTGRLRPDERSAPSEPLAGENARELVGQALVLAEHEADLAAADPDVTRGHVGVGADVALQLGHEALAEAHDLAIRSALRIEVRSSLAAAHRQRRQRVLEDLLEGEKLEDAERHRWVEAQPAL